jgi:hypothetical protein
VPSRAPPRSRAASSSAGSFALSPPVAYRTRPGSRRPHGARRRHGAFAGALLTPRFRLGRGGAPAGFVDFPRGPGRHCGCRPPGGPRADSPGTSYRARVAPRAGGRRRPRRPRRGRRARSVGTSRAHFAEIGWGPGWGPLGAPQPAPAVALHARPGDLGRVPEGTEPYPDPTAVSFSAPVTHPGLQGASVSVVAEAEKGPPFDPRRIDAGSEAGTLRSPQTHTCSGGLRPRRGDLGTVPTKSAAPQALDYVEDVVEQFDKNASPGVQHVRRSCDAA